VITDGGVARADPRTVRLLDEGGQWPRACTDWQDGTWLAPMVTLCLSHHVWWLSAAVDVPTGWKHHQRGCCEGCPSVFTVRSPRRSSPLALAFQAWTTPCPLLPDRTVFARPRCTMPHSVRRANQGMALWPIRHVSRCLFGGVVLAEGSQPEAPARPACPTAGCATHGPRATGACDFHLVSRLPVVFPSSAHLTQWPAAVHLHRRQPVPQLSCCLSGSVGCLSFARGPSSAARQPGT